MHSPATLLTASKKIGGFLALSGEFPLPSCCFRDLPLLVVPVCHFSGLLSNYDGLTKRVNGLDPFLTKRIRDVCPL